MLKQTCSITHLLFKHLDTLAMISNVNISDFIIKTFSYPISFFKCFVVQIQIFGNNILHFILITDDTKVQATIALHCVP